MDVSQTLFPEHLLKRATQRGKELAWLLSDIPDVIDAAVAADLVSIGGQLQFRFPKGDTCECYWVEVDTCRTVSPDLPWSVRVARTAAAALSQFTALKARYDFIAEGRRGFGRYLEEFEADGGDLQSVMCFVWYFEAEKSDANPVR